MVKLTIAHYYTPLGNDIHKVGIAPDVEVELPDDSTSDVQLKKRWKLSKDWKVRNKIRIFIEKQEKGRKKSTNVLSK